MTKIQQLKAIARQVAQAPPPDQVALLSQGFSLFSEETERLDRSYGKLREQFRAVNKKLEDTNERLRHKVHELHALTKYLDSLLGQMSQGLLFIDLHGDITTCNQAAAHILGQNQKSLLFSPFERHFSDTFFGFSVAQALQEQKAPKTLFVTIPSSKGEICEIEVNNTFLASTGKSESTFAKGLIILLRDITEYRRLQIEASRKDRLQALGEMAAQVAHEIRNPLGGIKGFAALLARDLKQQPKLCHLAEQIVCGADTLDRLVAHVLHYSRPVQLQKVAQPLAPLLADLKEVLIADRTLPSHINFTLENRSSACAYVDADLLKGALLNLLRNGIQAMGEGGTLTLSLKQEPEAVVIEVRDTGVGIPQEHLKKLFSPFFTTKPDGNGLGLAEVHKAIQAHGAEILVQSKVGQGTLFTIRLQRAPTPTKGSKHGHRKNPRHRR